MAGPDLSAVTALVEFQTAVEAVLYVAAALAYFYVAKKGVHMILMAVRGGYEKSPSLSVASEPWRNFVIGERISRSELDHISRIHPELREQVRRYSREGIRKGWF